MTIVYYRPPIKRDTYQAAKLVDTITYYECYKCRTHLTPLQPICGGCGEVFVWKSHEGELLLSERRKYDKGKE